MITEDFPTLRRDACAPADRERSRGFKRILTKIDPATDEHSFLR